MYCVVAFQHDTAQNRAFGRSDLCTCRHRCLGLGPCEPHVYDLPYGWGDWSTSDSCTNIMTARERCRYRHVLYGGTAVRQEFICCIRGGNTNRAIPVGSATHVRDQHHVHLSAQQHRYSRPRHPVDYNPFSWSPELVKKILFGMFNRDWRHQPLL